jgi:hypothetical protein
VVFTVKVGMSALAGQDVREPVLLWDGVVMGELADCCLILFRIYISSCLDIGTRR